MTPSENIRHSRYTLHQTIKPVALVYNSRVKHVFPSAMECDRQFEANVRDHIRERIQLSRLRAPFSFLIVYTKYGKKC